MANSHMNMITILQTIEAISCCGVCFVEIYFSGALENFVIKNQVRGGKKKAVKKMKIVRLNEPLSMYGIGAKAVISR